MDYPLYMFKQINIGPLLLSLYSVVFLILPSCDTGHMDTNKVSFKRLNASIRVMVPQQYPEALEVKNFLLKMYNRPVDLINCFEESNCDKYSGVDYILLSRNDKNQGRTWAKKGHQLFIDNMTRLTASIEKNEQFKKYKFKRIVSKWKGAEEIVLWMSNNLKYNIARSVYIKNSAEQIKKLTIQKKSTSHLINEFFSFRPQDLVSLKNGVCIDIASFGVAVLKNISPSLNPRLLKIKHEGIKADGITRVSHFLGTYEKDGKFFFFADSKQLNRHAGPFDNTADFVKYYEQFLGRKIKSYRHFEKLKGDELDKAI